MSRVDILAEAADASIVKFLEVTRIYSKDTKTLICIFEGEDEKYYGCRISSFIGDNSWRGINSGGRNSVLELREYILEHPEYNDCNAIYFIDRDYEDWFTNPDPQKIYVTPGYSVENFYANENCLRHILNAEFKISEADEYSEPYQLVISAFRERFSELSEHLLAFNIWGKSRAIMLRDGKPMLKIYFSDATPEKLSSINLVNCTLNYDTSNASSLFKKISNEDFCREALTEAREFFEMNDPLRFYRGKQQLEYFRLFLSSLREDFTKGGGITFNKKSKLTLEFKEGFTLSELAQYAETPNCLRHFLKNQHIEQSPE